MVKLAKHKRLKISHIRNAAGSNPATPTIKLCSHRTTVVLEPCKLGMAVRISLGAPLNGHLVQWLEHWSYKPVAGGSSPPITTINYIQEEAI